MQAYFSAQAVQFPNPFLQRQGLLPVGAGQGGSRGRQQRAVFGNDKVLRLQVQIVHKGAAQGRNKRQRAAAQQYGCMDVAAVGQRHHGLYRHGMEDGGGNVCLADVLGNEVLDVGLAEYAAARGNGVGMFGLEGQFVKSRHVYIQYDGHLVDKGPRAAGTVAVHAQSRGFGIFKEYDFGVLAADVNHGAHLRVVVLYGLGGGHYFLDER